MLGTATGDAPPTVDAEWRGSWPALAGLGVTALCVPEAKGGFGFQTEAAAATAHELGAALNGSPFAALTASGHVLAATAAGAGGNHPIVDETLAGIVSGELLCTFGVLDPASGITRAVDGAPEADALVLVDAADDGCVLFTDRTSWTVDPSHHAFDVSRTCGDVTVDPAAGYRLTGSDLDTTVQARNLHRLLLAADAVGCVQRMLDRTVAYAGERIAFGRPIGGFQAVQHRLADHAVRTRAITLMVAEAARILATSDTHETGDTGGYTRASAATRAVALAGVSVSTNAGRILHDLMQLTGGIGFTWEYGLHFFLRRAHQDARMLADPRSAERSVIELEGWVR